MARRLPGKFGGLYIGGDGVLEVIAAEAGRDGELLAALDSEPFIQTRLAQPGGDAFSLASARIRVGTYAYDELYGWFEQLLQIIPITPARASINVPRNRIVIGVGRPEQEVAVQRAARAAGIPVDAVIVELVTGRDVATTQDLTSRIRPVPAGVIVAFFLGGADRFCTLGPNLYRLGQHGFLVNSHCTEVYGEVSFNPPFWFWQNSVLLPWTNLIGNEAIDPPLDPCPSNPNFGCRYSDAAIGLYQSEASYALGKIARTTTRNLGYLNIDPSNPRFTITRIRGYSVTGEVLEKVGTTSGWSGGQVIDGCEDITPMSGGNPIGPTRRCSMEINVVIAGGGDSGAPVFKILSGTNVELRGMQWGMHSTDSSGVCWEENETQFCPVIFASNIGDILYELGEDEAHIEFIAE
jgi:hypothetical protein